MSNKIHLKTVRELTSQTNGYCVCGEKMCYKDCEICDILIGKRVKPE